MKNVAIAAAISLIWGTAVGCSDVEELSDVAYDDRFGATTMDVYLPGDGETDRPAVMFIHGGGWSGGDKSNFDKQARRLAGAGYVTASINYRLTPSGAYPNMMQDTHCALSFLRAQATEYGLDPNRVGVMGYSAGGHLASLLGVAIDEADFAPDCAAGSTFAPAAVLSGAGPQDLFDLEFAGAVRSLIGGRSSEFPERYRKASPVEADVTAAPPFLFVHATEDLFVPIDHSRRMRVRLRDAGREARLLELRGGGHLLNNGADLGQVDFLISSDTPEAWAATIDFFDRTIGPDSGAGR